jgi:hypothetical protein
LILIFHKNLLEICEWEAFFIEFIVITSSASPRVNLHDPMNERLHLVSLLRLRLALLATLVAFTFNAAAQFPIGGLSIHN